MKLLSVCQVGLIVFLGISAFAKNPPKVAGKTPKDTSFKSVGEHPPPDAQPWLVAPPGIETSLVTSALIGKYGKSKRPTESNVFASNSAAWWRIEPTATSLLMTQYRGLVTPSSPGGKYEPVLVSFQKNGVTYTVSAWQAFEFAGASNSKLYASRITHNSTGGGVLEQSVSLARPTGYTRSADSSLAANPYTDGVAPGRVYLTGLNYNVDSREDGVNPMAVRIWSSGDGGKTWDNGGGIVWQTQDDPLTPQTEPFLDKPWMDVSWFPATRGYVYVVFAEWHLPNTAENRIILRRSTNGAGRICRPGGGGCTSPFQSTAIVHPGGGTITNHRPQVIVNPLNGHVYVVWLRGNTIVMSTSVDGGLSFPSPHTVATMRYNDGVMTPGFRIAAMPIARYNHITNKIMVVWHDSPSIADTDRDIYLALFTPPNGSAAVTRISSAASYQFQPTVDNDDAGNVMVSYYSTENDPVDFFYEPFAVLLNSTATTVLKGPTALDVPTPNFPGDYRDIWYYGFSDAVGARWHAIYSNVSFPSDARITGVK